MLYYYYYSYYSHQNKTKKNNAVFLPFSLGHASIFCHCADYKMQEGEIENKESL